MRKWLNNYFNFTKSEFNGLLALIVIIVLLALVPLVYSSKEGRIYNANDQLIIKTLVFSNVTVPLEREYLNYPGRKRPVSVSVVTHKLFRFDPNEIRLSEWITLGLSPKQAASVVKFRAKGGKFHHPEDLRKMYTISPEMADRLLPYVSIKQAPDKSPAANATNYQKQPVGLKSAPVIVELNLADSTVLDGIRGIGPTFALRILKYRERLGGFYKKEQLLEVFGLDSSKFMEIKDQIRLDESAIRRININTAKLNDFKNHPYIRYKQVNAILQYRTQHGNFSSIADLSKVAILSSDLISRLSPYLTF